MNDNRLVCRGPEPAPLAAPGVIAPGGLRLGRAASSMGDLVLSWTPSCLPGAESYGIYEGHIGEWSSHVPIDCADAGADLEEQISPAGGDRYYLIVPHNVDDDGSYGADSNGSERAPATPSCRQRQRIEPCP